MTYGATTYGSHLGGPAERHGGLGDGERKKDGAERSWYVEVGMRNEDLRQKLQNGISA